MLSFIHTGYVSYFLIALNVLITFVGWRKPAIQNRFISNGPLIFKEHQWYRAIASSFIHLDMGHLFWNMLTLYNLGSILEEQFQTYFGKLWPIWFLLFYIFCAIFSDLISIYPQRNNENYNTLGASGAIVAVIAAFSLIDFSQQLIFFGITINSWLYLLIYVVVSIVISRRGSQTVNHLAHLSGAAIGAILGLLIAHAGIFVSAYPTNADYELGARATQQALNILDNKNGYDWTDVSNKYWTKHSLAYISDSSNPTCDLILFRSEGELLEDTNRFDDGSYVGFGQVDGIKGVWVAANAKSESSDCYISLKSLLNWK
jgi:membrane associated rhomboid family serine protease